MAARHRYESIADEIRASIGIGAYEVDNRLPSERRLVRTFGAQRNTVRQALGVLETEGLIESVGKSGWFVKPVADGSPEAPLVGERVLLVTFRRRTSASIEPIALGLREVFDAKGVQTLRYDVSGSDESRYLTALDEIAAVGASGVVLWPDWPLDDALLAPLRDAAPLVLIDRRTFGFESDSVRFDDVGGGRLITEHLIANGHQRIAFLGDEPFVESVQDRWRGYRRALGNAGIAADESLTVLTHGSYEPLFSKTLRILTHDLDGPPTAVVCSNDNVASRLLLSLKEAGVRVPQDLAVTGFGNGTPAYLDLMGLTSVDQSFVELGRAAGRLLLDRLSDPPAARAGARQTYVPVRLVVRASSGPSKTPLLSGGEEGPPRDALRRAPGGEG